VPEGEELLLHWHISDPNLTDTELDRLVDFMGALSDESFMPNVPTQVPSGLLNSKTSISLVTASGE
jgi:cytochrome c peroxidase